jgi:ribonuclease-3
MQIADLDQQKVVTAFTHPSFKGMDPSVEDYERLEFLGDAVLNLIAAEELIKNTTLSEGSMTEKRKILVNNETLRQIFDVLEIFPLVRTQNNYPLSKKDKADFIEAIIGAQFLDKDYQACKELWTKFQKKIAEKSLVQKLKFESENPGIDAEISRSLKNFYMDLGLEPKNAKSMLQELCQKQNLPIPLFEVIEKSGPDHDPLFKVQVTGILFQNSPDKSYTAIGWGKTKKNAEFKAAEALCDQIYLTYIPSD